jgi:hypothetical protein
MTEDFCIIHGRERMKSLFGHPIAFCEACESAEKTASDAPVWYSAEEASAWANGYNAAIDAILNEKSE